MLVLYPYKNALWALRPAKPLGVLSRHPCRIPNPFPRERAILLGLPPQTKQGCLQSAAQSHCTMRWHKWLTTCTGAPPQSKDALVACQKFCTMQNQQSKQRSTPHFQKTQRFIDRLKRRNYPPQQVVGKRHYQIYLFYAIKYLLPIVLFVGQHFSGSLFKSMHLSI